MGGWMNGGESEVLVRRVLFDEISARLPTFLLLLSSHCRDNRRQSKPKPNADGLSVFNLCSVQFGQTTSPPSPLLHFPVNPFERSHLKIDIKAKYVKAE